MARRDWERVKGVLEGFLAGQDRARALAADPLSLVRRYASPDDREVAGLVVACLAFGRVASIRAKAGDALGRLGPSPSAAVDALTPARARTLLKGWRHRMAGPEHLAALLLGISRVRRAHGSLGACFRAAFERHHGSLRPALADFVSGIGPVGGNLLADPRLGGACKRLNLYLRWMVRPDDGIDLGVWDGIPASALVMPLDTHIHRVGRYVGLTRLKTPRWETAASITASLARMAPQDPLRYDFALCHLGISGECRGKRVDAVCARCDLREVCCLPRLGPAA